MTSDNGIAFYNSQMMWSVTPIWDFQKQIASDSQGQRAARMYQFSATTQDYAQLTIVAVFSPNGLQLAPQYQHNVDAIIGSVPQPGRNFARAIASLIGFNQERIRQQVYEGALPKMRQNVAQEAAELGAERTSQEAAIRNVTYSKYLIGYDRLALGNLLIEGLSMRSRPDRALLGGTLHWLGARDQVGADMPQPSWLAVPGPGVSADVHLSSIMTNLSRGYLQSDEVRGVDNLMVVTKPVPPGSTDEGRGRAGSQRRLSQLPRRGRQGAGGQRPQGGGRPGQAAGARTRLLGRRAGLPRRRGPRLPARRPRPPTEERAGRPGRAPRQGLPDHGEAGRVRHLVPGDASRPRRARSASRARSSRSTRAPAPTPRSTPSTTTRARPRS